jgi:hypothetical protein
MADGDGWTDSLYQAHLNHIDRTDLIGEMDLLFAVNHVGEQRLSATRGSRLPFGASRSHVLRAPCGSLRLARLAYVPRARANRWLCPPHRGGYVDFRGPTGQTL